MCRSLGESGRHPDGGHGAVDRATATRSPARRRHHRGGVASTAPATTVPPTPVLALLGDSVPAWLVRDGAAGFTRTDAMLVNGAREACDAMVEHAGRPRAVRRRTAPTEGLRVVGHVVPEGVRRARPECRPSVPDVAVLVLGQAPVLDHRVDGRWVAPCDGIDWYLRDVLQRIEYLRGRGLDVVFVMPARLGEQSQFAVPPDYEARMNCVRAALARSSLRPRCPSSTSIPSCAPAASARPCAAETACTSTPTRRPEVLDWLVGEVLAVLGR